MTKKGMVLFMAEVIGNIFEEFQATRQAILEAGEDAEGTPVYSIEYTKLISELGAYFKSMKWARNDKERSVYLRTGRGLKTAEIAESLGINPNTYRSMVSTLSKRLRNLLFDGESMSIAILEAKEDKVVALRKHVEYLATSFDFYSMYADYELNLIQKYSEATGVVSEPTEEEMFTALYVLTLISKQTIDHRLSILNPLALQRVIEELTSNEYSVWKKYYQNLGVGKQPKVSESAIKQLKEGVE